MKPLDVVVALAIAASAAINAYLLAETRDAPASTGPREHTTPALAAPPRPGRLAAPRVVPDETSPCVDKQKQLFELEDEIEKQLPLPERFERYAPNAENEARLRVLAEKLLPTVAGTSPIYTLACHDAICRLEVAREHGMQLQQIQRLPEAQGMFKSMQVGMTRVLVEMEEPGRVAAIQFELAVYSAIAQSDIQGCYRRYPTPGTLELALGLDATSHRVTVSETGSLVGAEGARCLRRLLDAALTRTQAPADLGDFPDEQLFRYQIP